MADTGTRVFKILPTTQGYDWGKKGRNSTVAQLAQAYQTQIAEDSPYAEVLSLSTLIIQSQYLTWQLWMGTHPKSPSRLLITDVTLSSYLASHPDLIGKSVLQKFNDDGAGQGNLPFLFKVLSIEKALSIQSHPDKKAAEVLHQTQPDIYKGISKHIALLETSFILGMVRLKPQTRNGAGNYNLRSALRISSNP